MSSLNRRAVSYGIFGLALTSLSACSSKPRLLPLPEGPAPKTRSVFVATNRTAIPNPALQFEAERSDILSTLKYDISIPSHRNSGEFSFPKHDLNPERQFFVAQTNSFAQQADFIEDINRAVNAPDNPDKNLTLFVHGYNVSYPAAVFRTAQIAEDFGLDMPIALFSWPSAGRISRYAYDRDSALFARTALADTLKMLAKTQARKITIFAHSLGGMVSMEALKRLTLEQDTQTLERIEGIVLAQPDIDIDVFRSQIKDLDLRDLFVVVMTSQRDHALLLSSVLTGGHPRAGAPKNIEALRRLGVLVLDVSDFETADLLNHDTYASSPALISLIQSGTLAERVIAGAPGQDLLIGGANLTGKAALAIAYLPYTVAGL